MTRSNEAYVVVARVGGEIETFVRFGRWDADMKATELRRQHSDAEIKIARIPPSPEPQPSPVACAHEYIEAHNYGQERDNVECRKCGQLWLRYDRAAAPDMLVALRYLLGATADPTDPEHDPFWEAAADYAATVDTHHVGSREIMDEARNRARAAIARATGKEG